MLQYPRGGNRETMRGYFLIGCFLLLTVGCDAALDGDTSISLNATLINGTVEVPTLVASSVSEEPASRRSFSISPAISDTAASTGVGQIKRLDGTVLSSLSVLQGAIQNASIDCSELDTSKQVVVSVEVNDKKLTQLCDVTLCADGLTIDCGIVNADSTLATQQIYYQLDSKSSPDSPPSNINSEIAAGTLKPLALYKMFTSVLDDSDSAGSTNAASAYKAMQKAFRAALASGSPKLSDINDALDGGAVLTGWQGLDPDLASIDMGIAVGHIQKYIPAVSKTFEDDSMYTKYLASDGWDACAKYFGNQTKDELANNIEVPEIIRGLLKEYADDFNAGNTNAFNTITKKGAARAVGQLAGTCTISDFNIEGTLSSSKFDALEKLINSSSEWDDIAEDKLADLGKSLCNQIKAADSNADVESLQESPASFMGKIFDKPEAYSATTSLGNFDKAFVSYKQNELAFKSGDGCSVDTDCSGAQVCNGFFCLDTCTSNCTVGSVCTANSQCKTNDCSTEGICDCPTDYNCFAGTVFKGPNEACFSNSDCFSGSCLGGLCSDFGSGGTGGGGDTGGSTTGGTTTGGSPSPPTATKLVITTSPENITQSGCSNPYTVQRQSESNAAITSGSTVVSLSDDQGNVAFFSNNTCTTSITSITITEGLSSAQYYLQDAELETFTVTASASGLTAATDSVDVLQTVDNFISALVFPAADSGSFSEPSSLNRSTFNGLVTNLLNGNTTGHSSTLSTLDYQIVFLTTDTVGSKTVVALKETGTTGGGTYLFFLSPTNDMIIEAPHPVHDSNTLPESSYIFQQLAARALLIAGTHRCATDTASSCSGTTTACTESATAYRISDVAHNTNTYFQEAHKAAHDLNSTNVAFSMHGKGASSPAASISNGRTTNSGTAKSNTLADTLETLLATQVDSCNDSDDGNILCGTTNVQGRYSNGSAEPCGTAAGSANDRFMHLEQNATIRSTSSDWVLVKDAIDSTF
jgi:hypothetical protein